MVNIHDPTSFPDAKLITCVVPDDGRDSKILKGLRADKGIITANSFKCRGVGASSGSRNKKALKAEAVRVVAVVVAAEKADKMFSYLYEQAGFTEAGPGFMYQSDLIGATPFILPEGIPDEVEG